MILSDRQFFDSTFLPIIDSNTLAWKSPQLNFMAGMSGVKIDKSPSGTYETIIGEYDVTTPSHVKGTLQTPAFWHHLSDAAQYLSDTGKMIVKLPLMAIRFFKTKNVFNLSDLHILSGGEYLIATIVKTKTRKTQLSYENEDFSTVVDVKKDFILSLFNREQQTVIDRAQKHVYERHEYVNGLHIRSGQHLKIREELIAEGKYCIAMKINQKKVRFFKLEDDFNFTSSCQIVVFSDKETRDLYFENLNTKSVIDLQLNLSYNATPSVSIIPFLFNPSIISYAQSF